MIRHALERMAFEAINLENDPLFCFINQSDAVITDPGYEFYQLSSIRLHRITARVCPPVLQVNNDISQSSNESSLLFVL